MAEDTKPAGSANGGDKPAPRAAAAKPAPTAAAAAGKGEGEGDGVSRRDVLRLGLFGSALLFLGQIGGTFATYFWPRKVGAFGGKINIGHYSRYPLGSVTRVDAGKFYLVHHTDGLLAVYWRCTHLGCTVPWVPELNEGTFACNCHGSQFAANGDFISGPAPRPLDLFPVEIDADGNVIVDTGTVIQREGYSPDQATPVPS